LPVKDIYDRSLKVLAKQYPKVFIKLALGSIENLIIETIENPEINLPERRLDFVYGLQDEEHEYILHLDFQMRHEMDLPERMHIYNALLTASNKKPVISKVIYLERREYKNLPQEYVVSYQGRKENVFTYQAIKLWDYIEEIIAGELKELAPLLVLLTKEKNEEVLARSKELIFESGDEKWRAEALSLAVTVAGRYFPKDFLLKFFKEEMKMLREASIVQDWINEGIEKGIEKGKKSGKLEVLQEDILDILEERFGIIKKGISRKLELIDDPAVLKSLHKKSIKVASLDEFAKILEEVLEEE
jgi:predicted transposase YdaD